MSFSTSQKKPIARLFAVQAIFQMEASGQNLSKATAEFEKYRAKTEIDGVFYTSFNVPYFRRILNTAIEHQKRIDQKVNKSLMETWKLPRIDPTIRAIFRIASSEFIMKETPPKVIIKEYVKLAEAFSTNEKQRGIVNAVLENLANHYKI